MELDLAYSEQMEPDQRRKKDISIARQSSEAKYRTASVSDPTARKCSVGFYNQIPEYW